MMTPLFSPRTKACCRKILIAAGVAFGLLSSGQAAKVALSHREPCNLYPLGEAVSFTASLEGFAGGPCEVTAVVTNYFGEIVWKNTQNVIIPADAANELVLTPGKLEPGYYEIKVKAVARGADGKIVEGTNRLTSFGVAEFVNRTAEEARKGGYRYGLKIFQLGEPGVWWRKGEDWKVAEAVDASAKLGFQWTRHQFNQGPNPEQPGIISTIDLATKHPMNIVLKIEGFPEACYDVERYGPLTEWVAKNKGKNWQRTTVPKKDVYQTWLKEQIARLPENQDTFEVGNEVWDKMTGAEFAEWVQMVVPAVKEARPNAKVGMDIGTGKWQQEVVGAGGLNGVDYLVTHPYAFSVLPERKTRINFRNDDDYVKEKTGRHMDVYVTEYGWSTAPNDTKRKHGVSERVQAQRTARQTLMLYAEDARVLIPHWMADREQDPTEREHWFGFFRLTEEPKPVAMAYAASAKIIDGGRFVGDLWYGPGVGAMVFEKEGIYTLALWTLEERPGEGRMITVNTGTEKVTVADIMGRERQAASPGGKLSLKVNSDVLYVRGIGEPVVKQAAGPDKDLNPDVWGQRVGTIPALRAVTPPVIDGNLADWSMKVQAVPLTNEKLPAEDLSGEFRVTWDDDYLYVSAKVRDNSIVNESDPNVEKKDISIGDALQVGIGTRPDRQPDMATNLFHDYTVLISPTAADGNPAFQLNNPLWEKPIQNPAPGDASGIRWAAAQGADGWTAEAAIPLKLLKGLPAIKAGEKISLSAQIIDADAPGEKPSRAAIAPDLLAQDWPYLIFKN